MFKRITAVLIVLGLALAVPIGARAEEFASKTGRFVKEGANWVEYPAYDGVHHATFSELLRTKQFVALFDPTRAMILRMPFGGGMATWTDLNSDKWSGLVNVSYAP